MTALTKISTHPVFPALREVIRLHAGHRTPSCLLNGFYNPDQEEMTCAQYAREARDYANGISGTGGSSGNIAIAINSLILVLQGTF